MIKILPIPDNFNGEGVYKIVFSDGRFYIGSSMCLQSRAKTHINAIKSNFTVRCTVLSLKRMKDFVGSVEFHVIEPLSSEEKSRLRRRRILYMREAYHILKQSASKKRLNCVVEKSHLYRTL